MSQIYRKASTVVVYLSEDGWLQNSGAAIKVIKACESWYQKYNSSRRERGLALHLWKTVHKAPDLSSSANLEHFFQRPWWNRIWTLQEIRDAQCAIVLCGQHNILWSTIINAANLWRDRNIMNYHFNSGDIPLVSKLLAGGLAAKATEKSRRWLTVLASTTNSASTDPRDKLYALASMCDDIPLFKISYTKPVAEVYTDFTKLLLEKSKDLELLQLAGVNHGPDLDQLIWPSWTPNFANLDHPILSYYKMLQTQHHESHMYSGFHTWSASPRRAILQPSATQTIRPQGIRVGTIDEVRAPHKEIADPGWLKLAYKRFGTEYSPPTMTCHITQAYFRTVLGDRLDSANVTIPAYQHRFELAGTFWAIFREMFSSELQEMNISGGIDVLLLGEKSQLPIQVQAGRDHDELLSSWLSRINSFLFFCHRYWLHGIRSGMPGEGCFLHFVWLQCSSYSAATKPWLHYHWAMFRAWGYEWRVVR